MFNIKEYRTKNKKLSDRLPWGLFLAPGVIQNKNGSLQTTAKYRGEDPLSCSDAKNSSIASLINNAFKRFGTGWAIFTEEQKREIIDYPSSDWPNEIAAKVEQENIDSFKKNNLYITEQYITFVYLPPSELSQKIEKSFYEGENLPDYTTSIETFKAEVSSTIKLLSSLLPEIELLDDDETCTYLHSTISTKNHKIKAPKVPVFLDYLLTDEAVIGGFNPKIGDNFIGVISLKDYPDETEPNIFSVISKQPFEYRWVSRFICLDKEDGIKEFKKYSRDWAAKRTDIKDLIAKILFKEDPEKENAHAVTLDKQCDEAASLIQSGHVSGGFFTHVVVLWDLTEAGLKRKMEQMEAEINAAKFVSIREKTNIMSAWFGSLPGHCNANVRRPLITSLPFAHMIPSASTWCGPEKNKHLDGPPLFIAQTDSASPFRHSTHIEDVGSMTILGPTGTGKSTLLNYIAMMFQKYPESQIFYFDYQYSSYVNTVLNGGTHYDIGENQSITFQPLRYIDDKNERSWAYSWIENLLRTENVEISPIIKNETWQALNNLAEAAQPDDRTLSNFSIVVQNKEIQGAIQKYTLNGPYGYLFDSNKDYFTANTRWQTFEMSHLMDNMPGAVNPVLTYLIHRIDKALTGAPTLIPQDECFMFMENEVYGGQLKKWANTIRKHNASMALATTSLSHVRENKNASALIDGTPTKIFLPNTEIYDEVNLKLYKGFGLNDKQIKTLSQAQYKKDYYVKTKLGNRKFDLGLGEFGLAVCGSSSKEDIRFMKNLCSIHTDIEIIRQEFFNYKGIDYETSNHNHNSFHSNITAC